jgi:hypothetical protein
VTGDNFLPQVHGGDISAEGDKNPDRLWRGFRRAEGLYESSEVHETVHIKC